VFWTKRIWSVKYLFFLKKVEENYFKGSRQSLVRLSKRCKCSMRKTKQTDRSKERLDCPWLGEEKKVKVLW